MTTSRLEARISRFHHHALRRVGPVEDGVQRHRDGDRKALDQRQQMGAGGAAENSEFVLDPDQLGAARLDPARRRADSRPISSWRIVPVTESG